MTGPDPRRIRCAAARDVRAVLSLREVALLGAVPESKVRKDIETGLMSPLRSDRLLFRWADAYIFAAVYGTSLLSSVLRKKAFDEFERLIDPRHRRSSYGSLDSKALTAAKCPREAPGRLFHSDQRLRLGGYLFLDLERVVEDVAPRVELFAEGLSRIEERPEILGGEPVFRNTRLSVKHIGKMRDAGGAIENILEDYPYLHKNDVEFAHAFYRAHPIVGRPRLREKPEGARDPSA